MTAQATTRGQARVSSGTVTRFAPSPTGRLHLGHAWSAIQAHDRARQADGRFLLRIEDIDGTRSRAEHVAAIMADLTWLGLAWDGPVLFQSARLDAYAAALERLKALNVVYPCFCTRAEVAASLAAPHGTSDTVYPGTCRGVPAGDRARRMAAERFAWRLDMARAIDAVAPVTPDLLRGPRNGLAQTSEERHDRRTLAPVEPWMPGKARHDGRLTWHDELAGPVVADPLARGDVILARKDAPASYHLAVTIDDAFQDVTHVVRGRDLFAATDVHRLLQALLGLPTPAYRHHALLTGADGERLAKRKGAPTLESVRLAGEEGRALADRLRAGAPPIGFALASA